MPDLSRLPGGAPTSCCWASWTSPRTRPSPRPRASPTVTATAFTAPASGKSTTLRTHNDLRRIDRPRRPVRSTAWTSAPQADDARGLPPLGSIIAGDDGRVIRLLRTCASSSTTGQGVREGAGRLRRGYHGGRYPNPRILLLVAAWPRSRGLRLLNLAKWLRPSSDRHRRPPGGHARDRGPPNAIPTSLGSSIQRRLIHRMASTDDYAAFGEPRTCWRQLASRPRHPGRPRGAGRGARRRRERRHPVPRGRQAGQAMRRAGVPGRRRSAPARTSEVRLPAPAVGGRPVLGLADETLAGSPTNRAAPSWSPGRWARAAPRRCSPSPQGSRRWPGRAACASPRAARR